jgi:L-fuconolactonase
MIDSHQHFWTYDPAQYGWIDDAMARIRRDYLPLDLRAEIRRVGIDAAVSVQARQSLEETWSLLGWAEEHEFLSGVVGWVPLTEPSLAQELARLTTHGKLKGLRHVVQDEPDPEFMDRSEFNSGIRALGSFGLVYDILIFERQMPAAIRLVDRHPEQSFVLDHLGKPRIRQRQMSSWRENIRALAERPNVTCKLSGIVTEADYKSWTSAQLRPYFETVLEVFGPRRLMFGSDWPVCLVACEYADWKAIVDEWIAPLSADERRQIMGQTAINVYRL